jgi:hypothetical protein
MNLESSIEPGKCGQGSQLPSKDYDEEEQTTSQEVSVLGTLDKEFMNDKAKNTGTRGQGGQK